jgi:hypothetical protein
MIAVEVGFMAFTNMKVCEGFRVEYSLHFRKTHFFKP